jgi:hypothetical protein
MNTTALAPVTSDPEAAAPVSWEPCAEARPAVLGGLCEDCGWPLDDHTPGDDFGAARAA